MIEERVIRFSHNDFAALQAHLEAAGEKECQALMGFTRATNERCDIFICNMLILPGANELKNQTEVSVEPEMAIQELAYGLTWERGSIPGDVHTHPWQDKPHLSSIDYDHGAQNARALSKYIQHDTAMVMLVFGRRLEQFEAVVWDCSRPRPGFVKVDRLEVHGCPVRILDAKQELAIEQDDPYARHRLIPGWEQGRLGRLKVFGVGLGGNGALVLPDMLALGIGADGGWIKWCDPDKLEASNLPRIPYALPSDIGKSKAGIAEAYARRKAPMTRAAFFQASIEDPKMQNVAKEADVIVGCVDNDGGRKVCNALASRYVIPLIDIASEIIPGVHEYEAIGQVRVVVPGKTGCLMCSGSIDPSEAAWDQASEEVREERIRAGYVRGTNETPTPSVIHLNGVASQLGVSQLLRLVFGEDMTGKEFLHYERQKCQLIAAASPLNEECPVCGKRGYLAAGDRSPLREVPLRSEQELSTALCEKRAKTCLEKGQAGAENGAQKATEK